MVYVNEEILDNDDILYIVEKLFKKAIQWVIFSKLLPYPKNSNKYTNKYISYLYSNKCNYTLLYDYQWRHAK